MASPLLEGSRVPGVAYSSALPDVRQVARDLGVRYLLEGNVRRAAKRVRVNAQLIDVSAGTHVWARRYDREIADPFDLLDEVIRDVVGGVEYALWHALVRGEGKAPDPNTSPLRAAGWHITQFTAEDARAAIACCGYHLSHPGVLVMKSTEKGNGHDRSSRLDRTAKRSIL